jgi:hypothetical protein
VKINGNTWLWVWILHLEGGWCSPDWSTVSILGIGYNERRLHFLGLYCYISIAAFVPYLNKVSPLSCMYKADAYKEGFVNKVLFLAEMFPCK